MKKYLCKAEKEAIIYLVAIVAQAKEFLQADQKKKEPVMSKEIAENLSAAIDILSNKVIKSILEAMDLALLTSFMKSVKATTVQCMPNVRADIFMEQAKKEMTTEQMIIPVIDFENVLRSALLGCNPCQCKNKAEMENCSCKKSFLALDVPVFDSNAPDGICPYMINLRDDFVK